MYTEEDSWADVLASEELAQFMRELYEATRKSIRNWRLTNKRQKGGRPLRQVTKSWFRTSQ